MRLFFYFKGEKMNIEKIRQLNDSFRKSFNGGRVIITPCVQSLTDDDRNELMKQVQEFDNFTEDNDPYGEHDFGAINFKNDKVSRPLLRKKLSVDEVINQIKQYSEMPDTAVLIGLEGKYSHWTTVDKVRSSIKLLDSGSIKQIPIRNIPQIHQISKNDVYVIKARVCK